MQRTIIYNVCILKSGGKKLHMGTNLRQVEVSENQLCETQIMELLAVIPTHTISDYNYKNNNLFIFLNLSLFSLCSWQVK